MTEAEVNALFDELGFRSNENSYYGVIGQWAITANMYGANQIGLLFAADNPTDKTAVKKLGESTRGWGSFGGTTAGGQIHFTIYLKKYTGTPREGIFATISAIENAGFTPVQKCPYCKQSGCNTAAFYHAAKVSGFRPVHHACLSEAVNKAEDKVEKTVQNGSYILGIIGAVLGMLIGTLPNLLTIIVAEKEYAVFFALIPICAYFGYKLFRGKMNKSALIVTIIMAILGVYMLGFESAVYFGIKEYGIDKSDAIKLFFTMASMPENWIDLTKNMLIEFVFAALGVFLAWRIIKRNPKGDAEDAKVCLSSALPYPQFEDSSISEE